MKTIIKNILLTAFSIFFMMQLSSCTATQNANNKQKGAAIGAAGGAILGAILGNNIGKGGNGKVGAVIGGVVGGTVGVLLGQKMDKQAQKIEEEIPGAIVERVDEGIIITFDENSGVYFDTNKYNINTKSQKTLEKLSNVLSEYPDTNVSVVGHTDSSGSDTLNMKLSKNRANAVTNYFVHTKGLNTARFATSWYGETQPKFDNDTAEGRAKNRRVNVVILPNDKMIKDTEQELKN